MRAREPTNRPTPSSRTKNAASIASIIVILVDFDQAIVRMNLETAERMIEYR
jgi:hypothetical protein